MESVSGCSASLFADEPELRATFGATGWGPANAGAFVESDLSIEMRSSFMATAGADAVADVASADEAFDLTMG
ncbi:MAG: hypothetical protein P4L46_06565 [Fimbriimonas sp.]|nr:hypothetical protein [Fimbriimonas sp.]